MGPCRAASRRHVGRRPAGGGTVRPGRRLRLAAQPLPPRRPLHGQRLRRRQAALRQADRHRSPAWRTERAGAARRAHRRRMGRHPPARHHLLCREELSRAAGRHRARRRAHPFARWPDRGLDAAGRRRIRLAAQRGHHLAPAAAADERVARDLVGHPGQRRPPPPGRPARRRRQPRQGQRARARAARHPLRVQRRAGEPVRAVPHPAVPPAARRSARRARDDADRRVPRLGVARL